MFELQKCSATTAADATHCNRLKNHIKERIFPLTIIAVPILEHNTYVTSMEYSPLIGGFAITLNDGRAAYLTANSLKFDPNVSGTTGHRGAGSYWRIWFCILQQVQGIWAQGLEDATCASINHKFRLIAFGRRKWVKSKWIPICLDVYPPFWSPFSSHAVVYVIDDVTGGLEISHTIVLSAKDFPGSPGYVREMKWTPDGCAVMLAWSKGGISLWSTFGTMLMCSLGWDYGLHVDLATKNPLDITCMVCMGSIQLYFREWPNLWFLQQDWSTEGYQLFMLRQQKIFTDDEPNKSDTESDPKASQPVTNPGQKPKLMHTYSNLSDKSSAATSEQPHSVRTTLVQMEFVKSSFTVNPCMVSTCSHSRSIHKLNSLFYSLAELPFAPLLAGWRQIVHQSGRQFAKGLSQLQIIPTRSESDWLEFVFVQRETGEPLFTIVQHLHGQLHEWRIHFGAKWRWAHLATTFRGTVA